MTAPSRTPAEYKGVAEFLQFIAQPENAAPWHQHTGYVPVTLAGYEQSKAEGYYDKNPGADIRRSSSSLRGHRDAEQPRPAPGPDCRKSATSSTRKWRRRCRASRPPQAALDSAVSRGNRVLREFEKSRTRT